MSHLDLRTMRITNFRDYDVDEQRADGVFNSPWKGHTTSYFGDTSMVDRRYLDFGDELYELDEEEAAWREHGSGSGYVHHRHCPVCGVCGCTSYVCELELLYDDDSCNEDSFGLVDEERWYIEDNPELDAYYGVDVQEFSLPIIDTVEKPKRRRGTWSRTGKQRRRDGSGGKRSKERHGGTAHRGQSTGEVQMCKLWERADRVNAKRLMREIRDGVVDPDDCSETYMRTTGARW